MSLTPATFQTLSNNFMNDTFSAFKKVLVMRTAGAVTYGSPQTYTTESGYGIPLSLEFSAFDNSLIEVGDFRIFTNASDWTTDPEADNIDIVFDGTTCNIVLVEKDAASAAYFLTVRRK